MVSILLYQCSTIYIFQDSEYFALDFDPKNIWESYLEANQLFAVQNIVIEFYFDTLPRLKIQTRPAQGF